MPKTWRAATSSLSWSIFVDARAEKNGISISVSMVANLRDIVDVDVPAKACSWDFEGVS